MSGSRISIRFGAKKRVMYITRTTLKLLGFPEHIQFLFNEKTKALFLLPCNNDVLDSYPIPQWFWESDGRECEVTRKTLVEAILLKLNWFPETAYKIEGNHDAENNFVVFRLDDAVQI